MRPIMTSPCSVCGVTLEHDQDPRTVLCGGCERDKFMARRSLVAPPPTTEWRGKPPPPEPPAAPGSKPAWLRKGLVQGQWLETEHMPAFDRQHPEVYAAAVELIKKELLQ